MTRTRVSATKKLSEQMKDRYANIRPELDSDLGPMISTGSTLLDLAISGTRIRGGGISGGILMEMSGQPSTGKTVMLCEIAGAVKRQGGEHLFYDPEGRLNKQFAKMFGLDIQDEDYSMPDTIPQLFEPIRKWEPEPQDSVHGIFADSLAALSTKMEMEGEDKYGMRRAKEFSEQMRKTCRVIKNKGFLMVCSNQVRENTAAGPYGEKDITPGGRAIPFYSSLRLRFRGSGTKLKEEQKIHGKTHKRVIGVEVTAYISKNSLDKPFREAPITILYDYGIDDIRQNLQFIKSIKGDKIYSVGGTSLGISMDGAIKAIEDDNLEDTVRNETIDLWEEVERKFVKDRKPKVR